MSTTYVDAVKKEATTFVNGVEVTATENSVTFAGKRQTVTIRPGQVVSFAGIADPVFLIQSIHPNGWIEISSIGSVPRFKSWGTLFGSANMARSGSHVARAPSIYLDCLQVTGMLIVK